MLPVPKPLHSDGTEVLVTESKCFHQDTIITLYWQLRLYISPSLCLLRVQPEGTMSSAIGRSFCDTWIHPTSRDKWPQRKEVREAPPEPSGERNFVLTSGCVNIREGSQVREV